MANSAQVVTVRPIPVIIAEFGPTTSQTHNSLTVGIKFNVGSSGPEFGATTSQTHNSLIVGACRIRIAKMVQNCYHINDLEEV